VRDGAVLLGKYGAALALFAVMLALTLLYPGMVTYFARVEPGPVLTGYLGLFLLGAAFIALGTLASSLTENQIVAAVSTFGLLLIFWVLGWTTDFAGPRLSRVLAHLSALDHFENFSKGVLDTRDVIYYLNFVLLCLFLTLRSVESKRWRG
jgi:ABC-2 type transport system permease protein